MRQSFEGGSPAASELSLDAMNASQLNDAEDAAIAAKVAARRAGDEQAVKMADERIDEVGAAMERLEAVGETAEVVEDPAVAEAREHQLVVEGLEAEIATHQATISAHERLAQNPSYTDRAQDSIGRSQRLVAGLEARLKVLRGGENAEESENVFELPSVEDRLEELHDTEQKLQSRLQWAEFTSQVDRWGDKQWDQFEAAVGQADLGVEDVRGYTRRLNQEADELVVKKRGLQIFKSIAQERGESDQMFGYREDLRSAQMDVYNFDEAIDRADSGTNVTLLENERKRVQALVDIVRDDIGRLGQWERAS